MITYINMISTIVQRMDVILTILLVLTLVSGMDNGNEDDNHDEKCKDLIKKHERKIATFMCGQLKGESSPLLDEDQKVYNITVCFLYDKQKQKVVPSFKDSDEGEHILEICMTIKPLPTDDMYHIHMNIVLQKFPFRLTLDGSFERFLTSSDDPRCRKMFQKELEDKNTDNDIKWVCMRQNPATEMATKAPITTALSRDKTTTDAHENGNGATMNGDRTTPSSKTTTSVAKHAELKDIYVECDLDKKFSSSHVAIAACVSFIAGSLTIVGAVCLYRVRDRKQFCFKEKTVAYGEEEHKAHNVVTAAMSKTGKVDLAYNGCSNQTDPESGGNSNRSYELLTGRKQNQDNQLSGNSEQTYTDIDDETAVNVADSENEYYAIREVDDEAGEN